MRCPLALVVAACLAACGDNLPAREPDAGDSMNGGPCNVQIREVAAESANHVPPGAPIVWSSNPPATGRHYFIWARWDRTYPEPVPRGYWVHNLEHGGVVLLHRCPQGCPDDVAALEAVVDALPADRGCTAPRRTRTLITPDPELPADVRIAASSWGWTYSATCVDAPSLRGFIDAHYGDAPEDFCTEGSYPTSIGAADSDSP